MGKEGMIPCGQKEHPSKDVRRVGDVNKMGWTVAFQHAKYIMHVKVPSSSTVWKIFLVKIFLV
jgi:hypothetical protein